jgi:peptidyl-prolyl cis-trans isomerase SurA
MNLRFFSTPAAFVLSTALLATSLLAQTRPASPESPYGGTTVEEIIARVNDQIITRSDYDRAMKELDDEARQRGATPEQVANGNKDLLRNLIDQQLWLSKAKELNINGETELVKRLDEIRKEYHLETLEDLEKAAKEQGVSFEDFKANIRNGIITQLVMRQEVGPKAQFTPGEAQRYFEQHKQDYARPENVTLAEILVSTGAPSATGQEADDAAKLAAAKAKADDIEAKLQAGGDFAQLARTFSDGPNPAAGGEMGQFQRGQLAQVLEDKTFALKAGQFTEPIRTKQGFIILKVVQHTPGGVPAYKDVQEQVDDNFFMARMEPAMRDYLTKMREQAFIDIKAGYSDTGASPKQTKPIYSAYTPPAPKKKKKVERTRYRESTRNFRQKSGKAAEPVAETSTATVVPAAAPGKKAGKGKKNAAEAAMKPGKREKIRYGMAPSRTLPTAPDTATENAGALPQTASAAPEPANPLEADNRPAQKTRFSARPRETKQTAKQHKVKGPKPDAMAPSAPSASEVVDQQAQSAPLGLSGNTAPVKKKKAATTTGEKTRMAAKKKKDKIQPAGDVPLGAAPAPAAKP